MSATIDLRIWQSAPKERTVNYLRTYSGISRAVQQELRVQTDYWLRVHPAVFRSYPTAYPLLVYCATCAHTARSSRALTYDIHDTDSIRRAFNSAAYHLRHSLVGLPVEDLPRPTRERYLPYRANVLVEYVREHRRPLYRLFHAETLIVNALVLFATQEIARIGLADAAFALRKSLRTQLSRLSDHFDFSDHLEFFLLVATQALIETTDAAEPHLAA